MNLKVSVIIPVYNVEKYLPACLDSVLGQTLREIEVICVNDGSTDKSPEILQEYAKKDSRIIVINQENKGQGAARNRAIEIAKGEYIGFVDSDDYIDADFYEKLYNTAVKYNADIACASFERIGVNKSLISNEAVYETPEAKYKAANLPRECYIWNKIYKTSDMRMADIKFPEGMFYEDILFSHQVVYFLPRLVTVPHTFYHQVNNPYSTMHRMDSVRRNDYKQAVRDSVDFVQRYKINVELSNYPTLYTQWIKLFGLKLIKVRAWDNVKKYYLFNCIKLAEKIISE